MDFLIHKKGIVHALAVISLASIIVTIYSAISSHNSVLVSINLKAAFILFIMYPVFLKNNDSKVAIAGIVFAFFNSLPDIFPEKYQETFVCQVFFSFTIVGSLLYFIFVILKDLKSSFHF